MKTVSAVLLLVAATAFGWSSSGPLGGAATTVVVAPSNAAVIWAGNSAGVFRSTDGGATWASVNGPVDVVRMVVHPADANKAWALSSSLGLYRTTDGGATWISSNKFAGITATGLLIDPRDPDTLYVSGNCYAGFDVAFLPWNGLYKSTDGGATWSGVFANGSVRDCIVEVAIDPFSPWRLFLVGPYSDIAGPLETYDAARRWERPDTTRPTRAVIFDPRFPFTHYGISSTFNAAFLVSQDGGFTWTTSPARPPANPRSLTMDPVRGRLFLGTSAGLLRSGDGGRVWASTRLTGSDVTAVDFGGTPPSVFAATSLGLYQVAGRGLGEAQPVDLHDVASNVVAMEADPSDPSVLYAAVNDLSQGRFFRSTNGGASWERVPDDNGVPMYRVAVDGGGTVYAYAFSTSTLYRRRRGEVKWTAIRTGISADTLAADPKNAGTLFMRTGSRGVERSLDSGDTWQAVNVNVSGSVDIAIDPSDPRWVYVVSSTSFDRSADGGATWTNLQKAPLFQSTSDIVVAPSNGAVLYRAGSNGVERSDDRGSTWRALSSVRADMLAVDPHDENSVWAAPGLYHSADGGAHWTKVDGPFAAAVSAAALRFDAAGHVLHVAYPNHGVWELAVE